MHNNLLRDLRYPIVASRLRIEMKQASKLRLGLVTIFPLPKFIFQSLDIVVGGELSWGEYSDLGEGYDGWGQVDPWYPRGHNQY